MSDVITSTFPLVGECGSIIFCRFSHPANLRPGEFRRIMKMLDIYGIGFDEQWTLDWREVAQWKAGDEQD